MSQNMLEHTALQAAHEHLAQAAALFTCAREGHKGVNITTDSDAESYLCERCMAVYTTEIRDDKED